MPKPAPRRALLLHAGNVTAPGWRELRRLLPQAECVEDRESATRRLEAASYDLIVTEAILPGGGPFGLLRDLIARQENTTVVVHFYADDTENWLKLFEQGQFDLAAQPISRDDFFRWLEEWLRVPAPAPAHTAA